MRKPLTTVPQTSAHLGRQLEGKQQVIQKRAVCITRGENQFCTPCIIGGESEALGFHQETTEESRTQQNWFCIKLYIILYQISFVLAVSF